MQEPWLAERFGIYSVFISSGTLIRKDVVMWAISQLYSFSLGNSSPPEFLRTLAFGPRLGKSTNFLPSVSRVVP